MEITYRNSKKSCMKIHLFFYIIIDNYKYVVYTIKYIRVHGKE